MTQAIISNELDPDSVEVEVTVESLMLWFGYTRDQAEGVLSGERFKNGRCKHIEPEPK